VAALWIGIWGITAGEYSFISITDQSHKIIQIDPQTTDMLGSREQKGYVNHHFRIDIK
jgi:hypothetical protein